MWLKFAGGFQPKWPSGGQVKNVCGLNLLVASSLSGLQVAILTFQRNLNWVA
jgi:hypothetical protein